VPEKSLAKQPWSIDIADGLHSGENALGITGANVSQNGAIRIKRPGDDVLTPIPAGLGEPVKLRVVKEDIVTHECKRAN
jgi:hypothetical protein